MFRLATAKLDYSTISIKLLTQEGAHLFLSIPVTDANPKGVVREVTHPMPTGDYFMPIYDKGAVDLLDYAVALTLVACRQVCIENRGTGGLELWCV